MDQNDILNVPFAAPSVGTRPIIVEGALVGSVGLYLLSRIPVDGSYLTDLLPGLMVVSIGLGCVFVGVATAANAGVPADRAASSRRRLLRQLGINISRADFTDEIAASSVHLVS